MGARDAWEVLLDCPRLQVSADGMDLRGVVGLSQFMLGRVTVHGGCPEVRSVILT